MELCIWIILQFTVYALQQKRKIISTHTEAIYETESCPLIVTDATSCSLDPHCELLKNKRTQWEEPSRAAAFQQKLQRPWAAKVSRGNCKSPGLSDMIVPLHTNSEKQTNEGLLCETDSHSETCALRKKTTAKKHNNIKTHPLRPKALRWGAVGGEKKQNKKHNPRSTVDGCGRGEWSVITRPSLLTHSCVFPQRPRGGLSSPTLVPLSPSTPGAVGGGPGERDVLSGSKNKEGACRGAD